MVVVLIICNLRTGANLQLSPMRDVTKSGSMSLKGTVIDFAGHILGTVSKLAKHGDWVSYLSLSCQPHLESIELLYMIQCCWFGIVTMEAVLC